jgi:hypothetical protein
MRSASFTLGVYLSVAHLFCWLGSAAAFAQGGAAGSVVGHVYDQLGQPLRGVRISLRSPTQIGGAKVGYTDDAGFFRFPQLFPGRFELVSSAPKMKTYIAKDLLVGVNAAVDVNIVMEVETSNVEEVKIVEKAPLVSTTTSNVKEVYDLEYLETLPMVSRDQVHTQMINEVAGANNGRMRGGSANQTTFTQDGFELNQINGDYPPLKSSAAYEVNTAGYGADAPTSPGGMFNLVTKSGSNKTEFDFNATAEAEQLRFFHDGRDVPAAGIGGLGQGASSYYILAPTVGGPIIKDKLWYFFSDETHIIGRTRTSDPEGYLGDRLPYNKFFHKGTLKITWQVSARNKISSLTNLGYPITEDNMRPEFGVTQEAQRFRLGRRLFSGIIWESLLRDNLVLRAQAGFRDIFSHVYPGTCREQPGQCDHMPSVTNLFPRQFWTGNDNQHTRDDLFSIQTLTALDWYPQKRLLGDHSLSFKHRYYTETNTQYRSVPGDQVMELNGPEPSALTTFYANDPRYEAARFGWFITEATHWRSVGTLSDSWKPTRALTVIPSLSHAWASASNVRGGSIVDSTSWVPGLAAAWDATHDGRTVVRGSLSSYVDADLLDAARHIAGSQVQRRCRWNDVDQAFTRECTFIGGITTNTFGSPCGPTGLHPDGTSCRGKLQLPRTLEATLGSEREVTQGLAVSVDLIHRTFSNQFDRRETNRIWNTSGTELARAGSFRNGRAETISDLSTPDQAWRQYQGVTMALNKREGRFKTHLEYTMSRLTGTQQELDNLYGDIPGRDVFLEGYLPEDHRHEIKGTVSWQATPWLAFGARYKYLSGQPYSRLFFNPVTNSWDLYRAPVGINPGTNLNDPGDDRALRMPDLQDMNVQVRLNLAPLIAHKVEVYVDVLNALALRTATSYGQQELRDFGVENGWLPPFRIRLGVNYRY